MKRFAYEKSRRSLPAWLLFVCIALAAILLFSAALRGLSGKTARNQREILENAITRSITRCYAIEGEYPESLDYLKENYGLYYDESLYFVDYRVSGSNLFPDVTIIETGGISK